TNFAQILSSENDVMMSDNSSTLVTDANCACTNPAVVTPPASTAVCPGQSATFSVVATGPGSLSYQWRKNGGNIAGATATAYNLSSVSAADAAAYDVVLANLCGSIT